MAHGEGPVGSPRQARCRRRGSRARLATRIRGVRVAALGAALSMAAGCTSGGGFLSARGRDLADCAHAEFGFGLGLYVEAEATSLVQPAVGFADVSLRPRYTLAWDPRPRRPGRLRTAAFPTLLLAWPIYGAGECAAGYGDSHPYLRGALSPWLLLGAHHVEKRVTGLLAPQHWLGHPRLAPSEDEFPRALGGRPEHPIAREAWFGFSATVLAGTVAIGVNPLQIGDFLAGWAGWDPLGDDGLGTGGEADRAPEPSPTEPSSRATQSSPPAEAPGRPGG